MSESTAHPKPPTKSERKVLNSNFWGHIMGDETSKIGKVNLFMGGVITKSNTHGPKYILHIKKGSLQFSCSFREIFNILKKKQSN